MDADLSYLAGDKAKDLLVGRRPVEVAVRPDDVAVKRNAHRIGHGAHQKSSTFNSRRRDEAISALFECRRRTPPVRRRPLLRQPRRRPPGTPATGRPRRPATTRTAVLVRPAG